MSVTKVQRTKSVGAATVYAVYGTYEGMRNGEVRAAAYSVVSATPDATPKQFISETVAEIARYPQRQNQAELIIQSFHPDELDKDSPFDIHLAQLAGQELARRIAPNSDVVVATHTDSESGHLHNHIIIVNHDRETGKTPRNARNFHAVKRANDAVMKDLGLEIYEPEPQQQQLQNLRDTPLPEITKDNWRAEMTGRVDAVLSDPRVAAAPTVSDGLEVAQNVAGEYSVSFRVTTHQKENRDDVTSTSYALVNDDGEEIRYTTARGLRSTKRTGSRLGKERYTFDAVEQRIQELQQQYQQQLIQQQQILKQESYHASQTQEESEPEHDPVSTVGIADTDGAKTLRERYLGGTDTVDTEAAAPGAETETGTSTADTDTVHGERTGRDLYDERERNYGSSGRSDGRGISGRRLRREPEASASRGGSAVQPESAREQGAVGTAATRSSTPAPWSPDESVADMRQVDFDFLEQRVMDDEFRQFQRSEFDGTDAQFFEHLCSDDDSVALDYDVYVKPRTRLFNPVDGQSGRERALRTVEENKRRLDTARRDMARRRQQGGQRSQPGPQFGL
ncbi:relaxase/mobilization nuclease domain-containing protein [Corynebacterium pseudodiphtheriticum]|uniref:relaxase/mobilization nuclease domain-containing protein n=1 Tax=Corynebacterium pseudodiphtheriticum TaxID=37637 RepID=UPI0020C106C2|nr:relaxase/mobilization nuclease domain-containing protein [Corynebacterium pseudodiphtheriticum]UQV55661.1 relaxase/mobilization nuclease domain-containing protein [Corynebacterium pseudodiphtheriticum]